MMTVMAKGPAVALKATAASSTSTRAAKPMAVASRASSVRAGSFLGSLTALQTQATRSAKNAFNSLVVSVVAEDAWAGGGDDSWEAPPAEEGPKLYVGNLSWHVDGDILYEVFEQFGAVESADVVYDRETGRSRGFAFVTMGSTEEAAAAIEGLNGLDLEGRTATVNFPQPRGTRTERGPRQARTGGRGARDDTNKLFVGNLSWGMDDMGLEDVFSEFGTVTSARVITDRETGRSRGFGFVTMSSEGETEQAVTGLDGQEVDGRMLRVNPADSKPAGGRGGGGGGGYGGGRGGGGGGGGWDNYGGGGGGDDFYGGGDSQW